MEKAVERIREILGANNSGAVDRIRERIRWERPKAESRKKEAEGTVKLKILGIWVVLFVLICDCFVINLLDWICSLSCWFLVCLEDNNIIFEQWFCLEPMFNQIYQNFCFLVKRMCWIFLIHLKLFFFFFAPTTPSFLKCWGLPSPWGLRQLPNSPRGRASPASCPKNSNNILI